MGKAYTYIHRKSESGAGKSHLPEFFLEYVCGFDKGKFTVKVGALVRRFFFPSSSHTKKKQHFL